MLSQSTFLLLATITASTSLVNGFLPLASQQRHSSAPRTTLFYENDDYKDSERAHFERNLEAAMNNDWRMFRAKLIAQEQHDTTTPSSRPNNIPINHRLRNTPATSAATAATTATSNSIHNNNNRPSTIQRRWENARGNRDPYTQEFNNGDVSSFSSYNAPTPTSPSFPTQQQNHNTPNSFRVTRNTDRHGSHYFVSKTGSSPAATTTSGRSSGSIDHRTAPIEDPFVCEDELPAFLPETPQLDKHRWAHESPLIEPGNVLIANERLGGVFHQTVTLIVEDNVNGTFGIIINRPLPGNLMNMGGDTSVNIDLSLKMAFRDSCVSFGGPVWPEEFSVLHSFGEVSGARKLCPGVFIGGSKELMKQVHRGSMDPKGALFVKGHCAWEKGQLQKEINQGIFYMASASSDLVLRYAGVTLTDEDNPKDLWADILQCMGGKFSEIANRHGGYGDSRPFMQ